jgi:hypothetical protein
LALVSPALTSVQRSKQIEQEWASLGTAPTAAPTPSAGATNQSTGTSTLDRLSTLVTGLKDDKLKKELEALRTELRAANVERDGQRSIAIRSSLQQGAFMCAMVKREGVFYDSFAKFYNRDCSNLSTLSDSDRAECTGKYKNVLDTRARAMNLAMTTYSDALVESGSIYNLAMIEPEYKAKRQQFLALNRSNLPDFLDAHYKHLVEYLKDKKIRQDHWLSTCKAVDSN